jgi:hypothetical protein
VSGLVEHTQVLDIRWHATQYVAITTVEPVRFIRRKIVYNMEYLSKHKNDKFLFRSMRLKQRGISHSYRGRFFMEQLW